MPIAAAADPVVEEGEEGEHEEEQAAEGADVEQHARGVGRDVQVGRLFLVGHHGAGVGVNHALFHAAARLRLVLGGAEANNPDEMHE